MNIHGALNTEIFDAPFPEPTTVDGVSAAQFSTKIEARNPRMFQEAVFGIADRGVVA